MKWLAQIEVSRMQACLWVEKLMSCERSLNFSAEKKLIWHGTAARFSMASSITIDVEHMGQSRMNLDFSEAHKVGFK